MDPRDFADLASRLAAGENATAADLRTAVSRAYYAAFNVAIDLLATLRIRPPAGWEGHKLVAVALRHSGDEKLSAISHEIDDLRAARWAADYDMQDARVEDQRTVRKSAARAKQVIKRLDECEADPTRLSHARIRIRNWAGSGEGAAKGFTLL